MAFPTVEATAETSGTAAGTSWVVNIPDGSNVTGKLILVILAKGGGGTPAGVNALTGWTEVVDEASDRGAYVAYHEVDGTEGWDGTGDTITLTSGNNTRFAAVAYRISGHEPPGTQAPEISAVGTGTSQAPNPNTVTPTGGAKDYLWLTFFTLAGEEADDDTWANNAATNYSNLVQVTSGTGGTNVGASLAVSRRTNNAASEDAVWPAASIDVSLAWRAFTVAVHPWSGVAETTSPTDNVGITDFIDLLVGNVVDLGPDAIGITDTADPVIPAGDLSVTPTDNVGITDDVDLLRNRYIEGDADVVGITDSVDLSISLSISATDNIGITDSVSFAVANVIEPVDAVGITDSASLAVANVIEITDNIGITDSASLSLQGVDSVSPTDNIGITDSVQLSAAHIVQPVDSLGITDTASLQQAEPETVSPVDAIGITDSANLSLGGLFDNITVIVGPPVFVTRSVSHDIVDRSVGANDFVDRVSGVPDFVDRLVSHDMIARDANDPEIRDRSATIETAHGSPDPPTF